MTCIFCKIKVTLSRFNVLCYPCMQVITEAFRTGTKPQVPTGDPHA